MIVTLLWLTISLPFIYASQQEQEVYCQTNSMNDDLPESEDLPFNGTTEEKAESGFSSLSEYLHHMHELSHLAGSSYKHNCSHSFSVYVAFHGELLCPPPNSILS